MDQRRAALEAALQANAAKQVKHTANEARLVILQAEQVDLRARILQLDHNEAKINEWSSNYGGWAAMIDSAETNPIDGDNMPVFVITVSSLKNRNKGWIVTRREADFLSLHKQLREVLAFF